MIKKGYRTIIRKFLQGVEWAGPRSVSILIHGHAGEHNWADTELAEMAATRRLRPLRRLICSRRIFATPESRKKDKGEFRLEHDLKLRDVLAKFLHDRGFDGIEELSVRRIPLSPDAHIGRLYFELDNGHEDNAQLEEKLARYSGAGAFQVIFVMAHRYGQAELEKKRLEKLFGLGQKILGHKPNRILGATYHGFLKDGYLYNLKGERR